MHSVPRGLARGLRSLAMAAGVVVAGLAGAAPARAFNVPDPYASGLTDDDIHVRKLTAFGDSFTKKKRRPFHNWAEQLLYDDQELSSLADFAVSGATAGTYAGSTNDFPHQVSRWFRTSITWRAADLTVVYLGYNDIDGGTDPGGSDLSGAMSTYQIQLGRIINAGATGGNRHILLIMGHDWGRSPYYVRNGGSSLMRSRTQVWDGFVAQTAQDNQNVVAVDLLDSMDCVFNNRSLFGFTDVTDPAPALGAAGYLYDSGSSGLFHFGFQGQGLIEQVIQYYLTRAWDWSNTTKDRAAAQRLLLADLQSGQVFPGVSCPTAPSAPAVAARKPSGLPTPSSQTLEADPAHFGVAWARQHQPR